MTAAGVDLVQVIEAMVDIVFVVDLEGGVTYANTAAERSTGHTRAELERMVVSELLADDRSGMKPAVLKRVVADGTVLRREESWLRTKRGERVPVSVTAAPIGGPHGTTAIVLVVRDMRELRQLRSLRLLADRRATLGTLAGGVGHELRSIGELHMAALDTLAEHVDTDSARAALADLKRVGDRIATHAQCLTRIANPEAEHIRPLDLNRVVRDTVEMLDGAGMLRRIEVLLAFDDVPVLVTVNQTRIEQILVDLIINAADAITTRTGKIMLALYPAAVRSRIVVEVADSGAGIPPDVLPLVFDAFFTTKSDDHRTGLGLTVVREIVESYGGTIRVRSVVDEGTTFTFDLPMSSSR